MNSRAYSIILFSTKKAPRRVIYVKVAVAIAGLCLRFVPWGTKRTSLIKFVFIVMSK